MPLDPALDDILRAQGGFSAPDLAALPLEQALAALRAAKPPQAPPPGETALTEDRLIPGPGGYAIPARIYRPPGGSSSGLLVHYHGGGWVGGSLGNDDVRCHRTACRSGTTIISVDYRLAPEHRFPVGLEDAYAALVWGAENAGELGVRSGRLGVGGSSAGGNIAAAVTLLARQRVGPTLHLQVLTYPICDTSLDFPSHSDNAEAPLLTSRMMAWFIGQYVDGPSDHRNPLIAPLRAASLSGLPPALIITAQYDPLRDEAEAYAARLATSGVEVVCTRYDSVVHGFITRAPDLPQSRAAMDQIVLAMQTRL